MKSIITIILSVCVITLFAQSGQISGQIKNSQGEPQPFSNVALYSNTDSSLVTGAVTDASGEFLIKAELNKEFYLQATALGYEDFNSEVIVLTKAQPKLNLGAITISEDSKVLESVEVKAMRPEIIMDNDKMVVSVEGTAMAAGSSAFDVLRRSPGVFVDQNGSIQLNGKAGVEIMIDGRRTFMGADELQAMLQSMSAEDIKNIEIINNPSAKYDAEGNAGIINVVLKEGGPKGISGSATAGYTYNGLNGINSGLNLRFNNDKWDTYANLGFTRSVRPIDQNFYRETTSQAGIINIVDQNGETERVQNYPSLRLGADYKINDKHTIGVMSNLYYQDTENDFTLNSNVTRGQNTFETVSVNNVANEIKNGRFNIHHDFKIDTAGTSLSTDLNYVAINNDGFTVFDNTFIGLGNGPINTRFESENPIEYDIYSGRIDFTRKILSDITFETGLKASSVRSDNDLDFYEIVDDQRVFQDSISNEFVYTEDILAAYVSFSGQLSDKIGYKLGLRAEQTYTEGESITLDSITKRDYLNWFPSLSINHRVSQDYQVNYNYSRRIDRPNYQNLNPFLIFIDPYTVARGNPNLFPQYTHSFGITQTYKRKYNLILNYSVTSDYIFGVPLQDPETGNTTFQQDNIDDFVNYNATLIIPVQPLDWWSINNTLNVYHQEFSTNLETGNVENEQTSAYYNLQNTFSLPNDIRLELSGRYFSQFAYGLYTFEPRWSVNIGAKKSFLDDKLEVAINANDIFRTLQIEGDGNIGSNINLVDQYPGFQNIGFSLKYNFGNLNNQSQQRRDSSLEELERTQGEQ